MRWCLCRLAPKVVLFCFELVPHRADCAVMMGQKVRGLLSRACWATECEVLPRLCKDTQLTFIQSTCKHTQERYRSASWVSGSQALLQKHHSTASHHTQTHKKLAVVAAVNRWHTQTSPPTQMLGVCGQWLVATAAGCAVCQTQPIYMAIHKTPNGHT